MLIPAAAVLRTTRPARPAILPLWSLSDRIRPPPPPSARPHAGHTHRFPLRKYPCQAPGPGRVGSGVSGPERQAPAPPAAELSRRGPDPPPEPGRTAPVHPHVRHAPWFRAVRPRPSAGLRPQSLPAYFLWRRLLEAQSRSPFLGLPPTREGRSRLHGVTWGPAVSPRAGSVLTQTVPACSRWPWDD